MKFVMSYSCGKDSTLALHKMIEAGHLPVALLVMFNQNAERSFFHGADKSLLELYSKALALPMIVCNTDGCDYHIQMEKGLAEAKALGAEAACFGDIDIESNREWSQLRCDNVGISAMFPLWNRSRSENVYDVVTLGYKCLIKSINNTLLPKSLLGKFIDKDSIEVMESRNIDICGENGEYHTLAVDGPVFKTPLACQTGQILDFGDYSVIDVF